ncbi:hypothetical protein H920_12743 [Fukomys damarensis]|uniref:Uncharacterized protein n=1 Tax=Fukomys damarensis TaxID=885580 RepID=A0A091D6F2_FUKDA|nr:hypothetical protein H920_12743 [Fukomys damarensis]
MQHHVGFQQGNQGVWQCQQICPAPYYDVFSIDGVTFIRGTLEDAVCHRKPTALPALREEAENACAATSVTKATQGAARCTNKCQEAHGHTLSTSGTAEAKGWMDREKGVDRSPPVPGVCSDQSAEAHPWDGQDSDVGGDT